jgi:hypothetical protein
VPAIPARGVTLEADLPQDGFIILRSPTFRCDKDYCAGAVILAFQQALSKDGVHWETAEDPDQPSVELRVTYDPAKVGSDAVVTAMKTAMEAHPDPGHPGPVQVVLRRP